jgi:hypothetical protein
MGKLQGKQEEYNEELTLEVLHGILLELVL